MSASSAAPRSANFTSVVKREDGDVGIDVHVVVGADPRQAIGHINGAEVAGALVHHVGDDRGQAFLVERIGAGSAFDLQHERDDRDARMLERPHVQAIGQAVPHDLGKGKRRIRPDVGKPRPVDAGHDTETGSEPASASAG